MSNYQNVNAVRNPDSAEQSGHLPMHENPAPPAAQPQKQVAVQPKPKAGMSREAIFRLVGLGILTAIVIVLQVFTTFVRFGPFSITLALIPIVVGAAMYGIGAGAYLGAVFSMVVILMCITGADIGGAMVFNANPLMCIVLCMLKGTLAGLEAGVHYKALENTNKILASVAAALISPIVNTGVFLIGLSIFFKDTLAAWAGGQDLLYYIIFGLTGVNFLVELGVNVILAPAVAQIVSAVRRTNRKLR